MGHNGKKVALGVLAVVGFLAVGPAARADEATVTVGVPQRFSEPPVDPVAAPPARSIADDDLLARDPELRRAPFRLTLGPMGVTTGRGFGFGIGIGADFGTGSVGGGSRRRGSAAKARVTARAPRRATRSVTTRERSRSTSTSAARFTRSSGWARVSCT
jgi:hypothetical protein